MIVPQYSFKDCEVELHDLPETISFLDDDEIGSGWFILYDHGVEFYHGSYVTDYYTREITFADFRQEIERQFDKVSSSFLEIDLTISCDGDEETIRFYVYKSDLQLFTQVWDVMFSSEIPTFVVGTAQESIEAQLLVNGNAIFSGTYYMYVKRANIYDLRSVIETYCRVHNLAILPLVLRLKERLHYEEYSFTVIMAEHRVHGLGADSFLRTHFFTTNKAQLVSKEQPVELTFYSTETVELRITASIRFPDGSIIREYFRRTITKTGLQSVDVSYKEVLYLVIDTYERTDLAILSYTVTAGDRVCRFYVSPIPGSRVFKFRNCFNVFEYIAVYAGTVTKTETSFSEAVMGGSIAHYDIRHARTFEATTPVLLRQHAEWMNQLLQSREIYLVEAGSLEFPMVLIKEYTSELSDEPGAENTIKFTWQFADQTETTEKLVIPGGVFSKEFNQKFC